MKTVTNISFKRWQPLPALAAEEPVLTPAFAGRAITPAQEIAGAGKRRAVAPGAASLRNTASTCVSPTILPPP